ncbi:MAG TPA: circadian clock KaiB family protein [Candidatus Dormibacteraeota bacterium]
MLLKLYVSGELPRSVTAIRRLREICAGRDDCDVEVIDVLAHPEVAEAAQILATPTLVREIPLPPQRILGDLSDIAMVRSVLNLSPPDTEVSR